MDVLNFGFTQHNAKKDEAGNIVNAAAAACVVG